jgi:murein DD-endopeptidase MepM/ murein hydrolase activator NlpD
MRIATGRVIHPEGMYRDYVVQRGDDLQAIAGDLESTPETLAKANHLRHPNALRAGEHIKAPVERAYVVAPGDTMYAVARRFSVSPLALASLNDLPLSTHLRSGDQLALPADVHDKGPQEVAAPTRMASNPAPYRSYAGGPVGGAYSPRPGGYAPAPNSLSSSPPPMLPPPAESAAPAMSESQVVALAHGRFIWPVHGAILSRFGGQAPGVKNDGVDVGSTAGTPVQAAAGGEVVYAGNLIQGFGNLVLLRHSDGWVTAYAHLQHIDVQMRQTVAQGQTIGQVGSTGGVAIPELHFEVRYQPSSGEKARPIDPLLVLPGSPALQG